MSLVSAAGKTPEELSATGARFEKLDRGGIKGLLITI